MGALRLPVPESYDIIGNTLQFPIGRSSGIPVMSAPSPLDPGHSAEQGQESGSGLDQEIPWYERPIPPMVVRSQAAFRRDLPQLLKKYEGRWVAYNGDRQVAIGRSKTKLYQ